MRLMVCINRRFGPNPSCAGRGSVALADRLEAMVAERGLDIRIERSPCQGRCAFGPALRRLPDLEIYLQVSEGDLPRILDAAASGASLKPPADEADTLPPPI
jgi:(2Fe-2S) ferredoxin